MIIIDAVMCEDINVLNNTVESYLKNDINLRLLSDNYNLIKFVNNKFGSDKALYGESIVSLWFQMSANTLLVLTELSNTDTDMFSELKNQYNVICIDSVESKEGVYI